VTEASGTGARFVIRDRAGDDGRADLALRALVHGVRAIDHDEAVGEAQVALPGARASIGWRAPCGGGRPAEGGWSDCPPVSSAGIYGHAGGQAEHRHAHPNVPSKHRAHAVETVTQVA